MRTCLLIGWLMSVLVPATAQAPANPSRDDGKGPDNPPAIVVSFELLASRHMAVQARINGRGPYRLIFDTGAPVNLLSNRAAKDAGAIGKAPGLGAFPLLGMMGAQTIRQLQIGEARVENLPAIVMDHPTVAALAKVVGPLDGIVGFSFFARFAMTVDYQKKELTLRPNGYVPGDIMQEMMAMMLRATEQKGEPLIVSPAALWGMVVDQVADGQPGAVIAEVYPQSPAESAGLQKGDRLLTLDGRWTDSPAEVAEAASHIKPGREVPLTIRREGQERRLVVKPARGF